MVAARQVDAVLLRSSAIRPSLKRRRRDSRASVGLSRRRASTSSTRASTSLGVGSSTGLAACRLVQARLRLQVLDGRAHVVALLATQDKLYGVADALLRARQAPLPFNSPSGTPILPFPRALPQPPPLRCL